MKTDPTTASPPQEPMAWAETACREIAQFIYECDMTEWSTSDLAEIVMKHYPHPPVDEAAKSAREQWLSHHHDLAHQALDDAGVDRERIEDCVPAQALHCRIKWLAEERKPPPPPKRRRGGGEVMLWDFHCSARRLPNGRYRVIATGSLTGKRIERVGIHAMWELMRILASSDNPIIPDRKHLSPSVQGEDAPLAPDEVDRVTAIAMDRLKEMDAEDEDALPECFVKAKPVERTPYVSYPGYAGEQPPDVKRELSKPSPIEALVEGMAEYADDVLHWSNPDCPPTSNSDRHAAEQARRNLRTALTTYRNLKNTGGADG